MHGACPLTYSRVGISLMVCSNEFLFSRNPARKSDLDVLEPSREKMLSIQTLAPV